MRDGRALMPFGCPGEDAQCQAMVQVVCNIVDFGMNTQAAIEAPRVISRSFPWTFYPHAYEPGLLTAERRIAPEVREGLERLGHRLRELPEYSPAVASVCAIRLLGPGTLEGGADPRRESAAIGWWPSPRSAPGGPRSRSPSGRSISTNARSHRSRDPVRPRPGSARRLRRAPAPAPATPTGSR